MADLSEYTALITSEHNQRPKFMAVVAALAQPMVDLMGVLESMPPKFDLDEAVGAQLDDVGRWVGISRIIRTPLSDVYFSLDISGLGFDQGIWKGPFDPDTGLTTLDDDTYRLVIRAKIGANHWDGTMEGSVAILNSIFSPAGELEPTFVHANAEPFGVGDGSRFQYQLLYQGQPVYKVEGATLFRNDWQGNQLLYQTPRTNLLAYSEQFDNAVWVKNETTVTAGVTLSPDGSTMADKLVESATTAAHYTRHSTLMQVGTRYAASAYFKAGERTRAYIFGSNTPANGGGGVAFDLVSGTIIVNTIEGTSASIEPVGGGWWRCRATFPGTAVANQHLRFGIYSPTASTITYSGDGTSGLYVWGAQLEIGDAVTPYIPTTTSAVTLTDYTLSPTGIVELGQTPVSGATLTWTGDGYTYPSGTYVFIQDNQDMTMTIGIAGKVPSAVFLALLAGGYIPLKPEGVRVNFTVVTTVEGAPLFGLDVNNPYVAGFDVGAWGRLL